MTATLELSGPLNANAPPAECEACSAPATHYALVGKDGVHIRYKACGRHEAIARADAGRFLNHVSTKAEFLRNPSALTDKARLKRRENGR